MRLGCGFRRRALGGDFNLEVKTAVRRNTGAAEKEKERGRGKSKDNLSHTISVKSDSQCGHVWLLSCPSSPVSSSQTPPQAWQKTRSPWSAILAGRRREEGEKSRRKKKSTWEQWKVRKGDKQRMEEFAGGLGRRTLRRVVTSHCLIRRGAVKRAVWLYLHWLQLPRSIYQGQCKSKDGDEWGKASYRGKTKRNLTCSMRLVPAGV